MIAIAIIISITALFLLWTFWPFVSARIRKKPAPKEPIRAPSKTIVHDHGVLRLHSDGTTESVDWTELEEVKIVTTSDGPWFEDFYWVLKGIDSVGCIVPGEDPQAQNLLESMNKLESFDNEAVIKACGSTTEAEFLCWQKN